MSELQTKKIKITCIDPDYLTGNIVDVVDYLQGLVNDSDKNDTSIDWDYDCKEFEVFYHRKETLQEADERIQREKRAKERQKDRELEQLRTLQEKYG